MRKRATLVGIAAISSLLLAIPAYRVVHGLTLVIRAADLHGVARRLADVDTVPIREVSVDIPVRGGSIRGRVYAPARPRQTVLIISGVHPAGIDEPRLIALSQRLAEAGVTVVTPEIAEIARFEITPAATDRIEDAALWLSTQSGLAADGRIGLMGVSFSGGLAIVAAGRPSLRGRLRYVFSFGGHDDLPRVLDYFCTGIAGDGATFAPPAPHDYGVAIVLLNVAERLVPPEQVEPLRTAVRRFLQASYLDRTDQAGAAREFARLRDMEPTLPQPAATLLHYVNARDVAHLGPMLRPYLGLYAARPELSPARSPSPSAPIYLLHGRDDNVIPSVESQHLADRLRGKVPVRLLVTDLISHADADQPAHIMDVIRLALFWGDLLNR